MFQFLNRLVGGAANPTRTRAPQASFRPQVEGLEDRRVLSATLVGNNLAIVGSGGNDTAIVSYRRVGLFNYVRVQETLDGVIQPDKLFRASRVGTISFTGRDGDDVFENYTAVRSFATGGNGEDTFYGGSANDWFAGGNDKDVLVGGGGHDTLYGGFGFDILDGGAGNDFLHGGLDGHADELTGGLGADTFQAEPYHGSRFPIFLPSNRDRPQDFSALQGDRVVGMPAPPVILQM